METSTLPIKTYELLQAAKKEFKSFPDQNAVIPWETVLNDLIMELADDIKRMSILNADVFDRLKNNYPILNFFKICTGRQELVKYKTVIEIPELIDRMMQITQELYTEQYVILLERCHDSLCVILADILSELEASL